MKQFSNEGRGGGAGRTDSDPLGIEVEQDRMRRRNRRTVDLGSRESATRQTTDVAPGLLVPRGGEDVGAGGPEGGAGAVGVHRAFDDDLGGAGLAGDGQALDDRAEAPVGRPRARSRR